MTNVKLNLLLGIVVISIFFLICGCSDTKIQFNRKSSFAEYNKTNPTSTTSVTRSKGVVIYRTNESQNQKYNMNFGPGEINFNLQTK